MRTSRPEHSAPANIPNEAASSSILATVPGFLHGVLVEELFSEERRFDETIVSITSLASRFMRVTLNLRSFYKHDILLDSLKTKFHGMFQDYLSKGHIEWETDNKKYFLEVHKVCDDHTTVKFRAKGPRKPWKLFRGLESPNVNWPKKPWELIILDAPNVNPLD